MFTAEAHDKTLCGSQSVNLDEALVTAGTSPAHLSLPADPSQRDERPSLQNGCYITMLHSPGGAWLLRFKSINQKGHIKTRQKSMSVGSVTLNVHWKMHFTKTTVVWVT